MFSNISRFIFKDHKKYLAIYKNRSILKKFDLQKPHVYLQRKSKVNPMSKIRKTLATILALVMCLSLSIPAFAAEPDTPAVDESGIALTPASTNDDDGIMPLDTTNRTIGPDWHTVATSSSPIAKIFYEVTSSGYNGWVYKINIRCLDNNGVVITQFDDASGVFASNTLDLFNGNPHLYNIYQIQMQIKPRLAISGDNYYKVAVTW